MQAAVASENSKMSYTKVVSEFDLVMQVSSCARKLIKFLHVIIHCSQGDMHTNDHFM